MNIKKIEIYREDNGRYSTSEARQDDISGVYYQAADVDAYVSELTKENKDLESKREYDIEVMREAQQLLKDGALGAIVDTVWCSGDGNITLWEKLEMAIDTGES
jgi:hypothetical protein